MTQNRKQKTKEERDQEIKFNKHCGTRLRNIRCKNGYSQTNIADELNVSFQQIQKYEKGFNGLTYEKSCKLAKFFNVDVNCYILAMANFEIMNLYCPYQSFLTRSCLSVHNLT